MAVCAALNPFMIPVFGMGFGPRRSVYRPRFAPVMHMLMRGPVPMSHSLVRGPHGCDCRLQLLYGRMRMHFGVSAHCAIGRVQHRQIDGRDACCVRRLWLPPTCPLPLLIPLEITDLPAPDTPLPPVQPPHVKQDVIETEDAYNVTMDVPGFAPGDIHVALANGHVTVTGDLKGKPSQVGADGAVLRRERSTAAFRRTFAMPSSVNADKVEAFYHAGVLELVMPKVR